MNRIIKAAHFAALAHGEQKRKYTGEPYICHTLEVADYVSRVIHTEDMLIAAILHDVVEDTPVTLEAVIDGFGAGVGDLVYWLTDVSKLSDGNRDARKAIDRQHIAKAPPQAKTIKLADLISNTLTIERHDPNFAKVYLEEKRLLLDVLTEGDRYLYEIACALAGKPY